jgi:pilus assembly protein Flp/PilA
LNKGICCLFILDKGKPAERPGRKAKDPMALNGPSAAAWLPKGCGRRRLQRRIRSTSLQADRPQGDPHEACESLIIGLPRAVEGRQRDSALQTGGRTRPTNNSMQHHSFWEIEAMTVNNFALKLRRFLTSEDGPTAVEYAVMLALIIIVCLTAISSIGTNASTTFNNVSQSISGS